MRKNGNMVLGTWITMKYIEQLYQWHSVVLGMQRYYREKVLKGKIDSFDTKRERSAISHFHGYNLYTTSKDINIFLSIYNIISINILQTIKYLKNVIVLLKTTWKIISSLPCNLCNVNLLRYLICLSSHTCENLVL